MSERVNLSNVPDDPSLVQFSIRAYVYAATPDLLDQQKDDAIRAMTAYAPAVVTTALPWNFFNTAVRETSLASASMGSMTETPPSSTVTVFDHHNMFFLLNTGAPQQVRITVLDDKNHVLGVPFITRELGKDELYSGTRFEDIFGNSMIPAGVTGDAHVHVLFEGLRGGTIFYQNEELIGAPYAVNTTPTWSSTGMVVGQ